MNNTFLKSITGDFFTDFPDGILAVDTETRKIVDINSIAAKLFGYTRKEIIDRDVLNLHPASHRERIKKLLSELVSKKFPYFPDIPFVRKNGEVFYVDIAAARVNYNGSIIAVGFLRDRSRLINTGCNWNLLYQQLSELTGYGVCIICSKKFVFVNNNFVDMLGGKAVSQSIGKEVSFFIPEQDQENLNCVYESLITGAIPVFVLNQRIKKLDGNETNFLIKGVRTNFNGELAAHCIITESVSEKSQVVEKIPGLTNGQKLMITLSKRESEVMCLIATGKTTKQIARHLGIAYHTVMAHKHSIMKKLGLKTDVELALFAIRNGFVRLE